MEERKFGNVSHMKSEDRYQELVHLLCCGKKKVIGILFASGCLHSLFALNALYASAVMHEDIAFITLEVAEIKNNKEIIKTERVHRSVGIERYPTFVVYSSDFTVKDKVESEKKSNKEQFTVLEEFISRNFSQSA